MASAASEIKDGVNHEVVDDDFIRRALRSANLNALRIALYHQTRDPALAAIPVDHQPIQGGALIYHAIPKQYHDEIREKAFEFLASGRPAGPMPTREEATELMMLFTGERPSDAQLEFGFDDLAFDEFPREAKWSAGRPDAADAFSVTIIGAGFSGIIAAIQLDRLGIKYRIIDRLPDIGGTWQVNDYPEARVDVSNFLYQYKFVKYYPWKSYFATQAEIKEYACHVVDAYGLRSRISLNTTLKSATWNEAKAMWELVVEGPDGASETIASNIVLSGAGLFSTANVPNIAGIERFQGEMFHTTNWNHDYDYSGKDIGLIGTGSTGSQLLPALAARAARVTVYQRTPQWVMPVKDYHGQVSAEKHWLLRNFPGYWNWFVYSNYIGSMQIQQMQEIDPEWEANGGQINAKASLAATPLPVGLRSICPLPNQQI